MLTARDLDTMLAFLLKTGIVPFWFAKHSRSKVRVRIAIHIVSMILAWTITRTILTNETVRLRLVYAFVSVAVVVLMRSRLVDKH